MTSFGECPNCKQRTVGLSGFCLDDQCGAQADTVPEAGESQLTRIEKKLDALEAKIVRLGAGVGVHLDE